MALGLAIKEFTFDALYGSSKQFKKIQGSLGYRVAAQHSVLTLIQEFGLGIPFSKDLSERSPTLYEIIRTNFLTEKAINRFIKDVKTIDGLAKRKFSNMLNKTLADVSTVLYGRGEKFFTNIPTAITVVLFLCRQFRRMNLSELYKRTKYWFSIAMVPTDNLRRQQTNQYGVLTGWSDHEYGHNDIDASYMLFCAEFEIVYCINNRGAIQAKPAHIDIIGDDYCRMRVKTTLPGVILFLLFGEIPAQEAIDPIPEKDLRESPSSFSWSSLEKVMTNYVPARHFYLELLDPTSNMLDTKKRGKASEAKEKATGKSVKQTAGGEETTTGRATIQPQRDGESDKDDEPTPAIGKKRRKTKAAKAGRPRKKKSKTAVGAAEDDDDDDASAETTTGRPTAQPQGDGESERTKNQLRPKNTAKLKRFSKDVHAGRNRKLPSALPKMTTMTTMTTPPPKKLNLLPLPPKKVPN